MIEPHEVKRRIELFDPYLKEKLLPFWLERAVDEEHGGFLSYFDRDGEPTGETDKTLICQLRMIFTFSSAHRAGLGQGRCLEAAAQGVEFVVEKFWDSRHGGWFWITDRQGRTLDESKIMYGQSFGVYALSEYALASGDPIGRTYAESSFDAILRAAADTCRGGYWEMFERDWTLKPGGEQGGDRKTLDVHMHLMEAFTALYELTRLEVHRRKLLEIIELLTRRMLHPTFRTGLAQFDAELRPLPAILFRNVWGSDRPPEEEARPVDNTNYGHNIEFAWLLHHALDVLELDPGPWLDDLRCMLDQAFQYGVDWEYGGVYVEGPADGPAIQTLKEFWQQAEALVGFLDGYLLLGDERYWQAFTAVFDFVWNKGINHRAGEWYALLERDGSVKWDYLGHAWKINYHTVRAVIQTLKRLRQLYGSLTEEKQSGAHR